MYLYTHIHTHTVHVAHAHAPGETSTSYFHHPSIYTCARVHLHVCTWLPSPCTRALSMHDKSGRNDSTTSSYNTSKIGYGILSESAACTENSQSQNLHYAARMLDGRKVARDFCHVRCAA